MKKVFSLLATALIATASIFAEDYTPWGYYLGNMESDNLGLIGAGAATHRVAIFVPGEGILAGGTIAGVNVPVYDPAAVTAISAWVTPTLSSDESYTQQVELTSYESGYNQVIFPESYTVTESGCYVGYTITVNTSLNTQGSKYPIIYDPSTLSPNSFWILYSAQYGWQDIGNDYGQSCLQALFSNLQLPETAAHFGTIKNAVTGVDTETEWPVTVYSDAAEAVSNIEYTIDVNGVKETRTSDVAIESGFNKSAEIMVKVASPSEVGVYDVTLAITKVNGKENSLADNVTVITFKNLSRIVQRNTVVEEFTGTGCGWCPRGMQGMANLRAEFGDRFIGLAFHAYNTSDPMYPNYYLSPTKLGISGAPSCIIDRKEVVDPYYGTQKNERYVLQDFEDYCSIPAEVDLGIKSEWTGANNDSVKIDVALETLTNGSYEVVYVLTADSLTGTSNAWRQLNYYYQYSASEVGEDDLAKFCKGGEYGTSRFYWNFDDVVIASSYNKEGANLVFPLGNLAAGANAESSYTLGLPTNAALREAVDASIDKVFVVVFVVNAEGSIAQAVKTRVGESTIIPISIERIENDETQTVAPSYDLQGRPISIPRRGQLFIRDGRKMMLR